MERELRKLEELIIETINGKSLTIEQVRKLTGVSKPTIIKMMKGRSKNHNARTLMTMANGLGISKSDIRKAME